MHISDLGVDPHRAIYVPTYRTDLGLLTFERKLERI